MGNTSVLSEIGQYKKLSYFNFTCILSIIVTSLKGGISQGFRGKHIIWVLGAHNWKLPTQLIIFLDFWAKILKIAHQVNHSYLPPCLTHMGHIRKEKMLSLSPWQPQRQIRHHYYGNYNGKREAMTCQSLTWRVGITCRHCGSHDDLKWTYAPPLSMWWHGSQKDK